MGKIPPVWNATQRSERERDFGDSSWLLRERNLEIPQKAQRRICGILWEEEAIDNKTAISVRWDFGVCASGIVGLPREQEPRGMDRKL